MAVSRLLNTAVKRLLNTAAKPADAQPSVASDSIEPMQSTIGAIDPRDVIAWLVTQPNANGTLYLENVVRAYMRALRGAPKKLVLQTSRSCNVFECRTVAEFDELWASFKAAPNYVDLNRILWGGQLSAGLAVYRRYLEHLENGDDATTREPRDSGAVRTRRTYSRPAYAAPVASPKPMLDPALVERLTDLLSSRFSNGYRLNSPIEMARFRSFAADELEEELSLSDEELKAYIRACGTTYDGKVYAVSNKAKERIRGLAEGCFANGARAIFFEEFYAKNENWLFGESVVSEDMLIGILRSLFPKLTFTRTYFGYTDASISALLESELLRVWDGDVLLTYGQLAERLPYIPLDRIRYALGQNGDFIWNSAETFSHISRIAIADDERESIRAAAVRECNARGYVAIANLPSGEIAERNYELSVTALHNAIYRICLSDRFDKRGKIVTRKGDVFDALTIMKEYCRTIDKCSLEDLLDYEKELTGEVHRWIPMEAGNTILVRIDKDSYVADRYVHFDADVIDEAIESVVKGDYLPLKAFTAFGAFPYCGQTWNLFLFESYCRRFSRRFRFDAPSVNSRNAGAVIRRSCGMDYTEIMADAVANADVPLKAAVVGRFLADSGYTGRSMKAKVTEIIIDRARAIRERRD